MKVLSSQVLRLDLPTTQIQLIKSRCLDSTGVVLKVLVAFEANVILQLILPFSPVVHPPGRVPEALREPLKKELVYVCVYLIGYSPLGLFRTNGNKQ